MDVGRYAEGSRSQDSNLSRDKTGFRVRQDERHRVSRPVES